MSLEKDYLISVTNVIEKHMSMLVKYPEQGKLIADHLIKRLSNIKYEFEPSLTDDE